MNLFSGALVIAAHDLRRYFRDRVGMGLGLALPIVLVLVFGFVMRMMAAGEGGLSKTTLWVADQDDSEASRAFVEALRHSDVLRVKPEPGAAWPAEAKLKQDVEDGEAHHALVILPGFAKALSERRFPELRMYRDPGREMERQLVSIGLMQSFMSAGSREIGPMLTARGLEMAGLPRQWRDRIESLASAFSKSIESMFDSAKEQGLLDENSPAADQPGGSAKSGSVDVGEVFTKLVPVTNVDIAAPERPKQLTYMLAQSVSGISVMMLMFGLMACGGSLIREREGGTLPRLLLSSLPRDSILLGKLLFCCAIGALQLAVMFTIGGFVFHVDFLRDPATLSVLSAVLLVAVTAFGVVIAAAARTEKQAEGFATLVILVMSALGGAWFPMQMLDLPPAAAIVTRCTLTWWAMSGMQGMLWYGKSWTDPTMLRDMGVLLGFGALALIVAFVLFRKRYADVR